MESMNTGELFTVFPTDELRGASWSQQKSKETKGDGSSQSMDQSYSTAGSLQFKDRKSTE